MLSFATCRVHASLYCELVKVRVIPGSFSLGATVKFVNHLIETSAIYSLVDSCKLIFCNIFPTLLSIHAVEAYHFWAVVVYWCKQWHERVDNSLIQVDGQLILNQ